MARITEIIAQRRPVFSFEFFPPRTDEGQRNLERAITLLKDDDPDHVSVTNGAGGTTRERTLEVTSWIKRRVEDADGVMQLGVAFATMQCSQLLDAGAPGIHFYTLNRSPATRAILAALRGSGAAPSC